MVETESNMMPLGAKAPDFTLFEPATGKNISLQGMKSDKATVIMFICNHCPFVKHIQNELVNLANDYMKKGVSFIAINSNDVVNYPQDSPENMVEEVNKMNYPFPYLYDESQEVAKSYKAACTPDFYIFDKDLRCVYRGQLDSSRPGNNIPVTGEDIRNALDSILQGKEVSNDQKPSIGCNIKWKA